jgi:hypothetical protein
MSDEERQLNRRLFLKYTAVASATAATWYGVNAKTDALAQPFETRGGELGSHTAGSPYAYHDE